MKKSLIVSISGAPNPGGYSLPTVRGAKKNAALDPRQGVAQPQIFRPI